MPEEIESQKEVEETTTTPDSGEKQTEQPADDTAKTEGAEEQVTLSAKEVETLRKKANDFERMTQTKRGEKLLSKMKSTEVENDVEDVTPTFDIEEFKNETIKAAEEAALRIVDSANTENRKVNVVSAYEQWIKENPWADNDEVFTSITQNIKPTNSTKIEDLLAELDRAALLANPRLYTENVKSKIRKEVMLEQQAIEVGSGGGNGTSVRKEEVDVVITKEEQTIIDKYFGGDKARFLKTKINN